MISAHIPINWRFNSEDHRLERETMVYKEATQKVIKMWVPLDLQDISDLVTRLMESK